ncbi:DUF1642 domain-containing protein [Enterococcus faecium]|uniref:DUF1642 domain-containing protein n=1 Tax=Enterococcus faecium TaxID=1352 RepID=UPI002072F6F4|nr:DUF1642 domain-containing protein [Enterococcus faecium]MCM6879543.1 DUF1642 domain-containing protein [Enterococcus faecium]
MDKQELIEKIKANGEWFETNRYVKITKAIEFIKQLDEPQKVKVPAFVAPFIDKLKTTNRRYGVELERAYESSEVNDLRNWLWFNENVLTVFKALENGYEVEEEPVWAIKNADGNYLTKCALWGKDGVNYSFECNPSHRLLFTDKATADATALLVNGTVEEVVER